MFLTINSFPPGPCLPLQAPLFSLGCGSAFLLRLPCTSSWKILYFLNHLFNSSFLRNSAWEVKIKTACLKCLCCILKFDRQVGSELNSSLEIDFYEMFEGTSPLPFLMGLLRLLISFLFLSLCGCPVFPIRKLSRSFLYAWFWSLGVMDAVQHQPDAPSGMQLLPQLLGMLP